MSSDEKIQPPAVIPMTSLHPKHVYSVFWVLTHVFGISRTTIREFTGISLRAMRRIDDGYIPNESTQRKFRAFLRDVVNQVDRTPRPTELPIKQWHEALIAVGEYLKTATRKPSKNPLFDAIRSNVPTFPDKVLRAHIIKELSPHYTKEQIITQANKMGVISTTDKLKRALWTLPPNGAPNQPQRPPYKYQRPKGIKKQRLHDELQKYVQRGPDGKRSVKDIEQEFRPRYSRNYLFEAFHELNFGRETTGFGKDKTTYWFQIYPKHRNHEEPDALCTQCASPRLIKFPNGEFLCKDCSHTFTLVTPPSQEQPDAE